MVNLRDIVDSYYKAVDASTDDPAQSFLVRGGHVLAITDLFAEGAKYHRLTADHPEECYQGKHEIENFFLNKRRLVGVHVVTRYKEESSEDNVMLTTHGFFHGKYYNDSGREGHVVRLSFSDTWRCNKEGKILERWSTIKPVGVASNLGMLF